MPCDPSRPRTYTEHLTPPLGLDITAPGSDTVTTGLAGLLNVLSNSTPSPLGNMLDAQFSNAMLAAEPWSPALISSQIGDLSALGTILGRTMAPLAAVQTTAAGVAAQAGGLAPLSAGLGTLAGGYSGEAAATAAVGRATLVGALSAPHGWAAAAPGLNAGPGGPAAASSRLPFGGPSLTVGPTGLPGTGLPGSVPARQHDTPRYGFRLSVLGPQPDAAGGAIGPISREVR